MLIRFSGLSTEQTSKSQGTTKTPQSPEKKGAGSRSNHSGDHIATETLNIPSHIVDLFNKGDSSSSDSSLNTSRIFGYHDSGAKQDTTARPKEPYNAKLQGQPGKEKKSAFSWLSRH